ncbi:hypothetical protein D9758_014113 [Tetrapyrgos nigripes]|uniref:Cleavage stimulation factor subunit 2 hinge domain-containing protein n=1 Tax=Tetrapyrgos nigripes TaxID=182062 RepID=A0A8H5FJG1_9AGAR|nr:hypothetical protein D9758_014113 [Tetrapyrgos nigripes]
MSAVRNLNNFEVGGRPLRIDLADSDPLLEGKTTVRGELVDTGGGGWHRGSNSYSNESIGSGSKDSNPNANSILANLPLGQSIPPGSSAMDAISTLLATIGQREMMDVLAHMKAFVITHPEQARTLLSAHPQLAYALFQALVLNRVVDESILQRMLAATGASARLQQNPGPQAPGQAPPPGALHAPTPTVPHPQQAPASYPSSYPPPFIPSMPPPGIPPTPPNAIPPYSAAPPGQFPPYSSMPPPSAMFPHAVAYYGARPGGPGAVSTPPPGSGTPVGSASVPPPNPNSPLKSPLEASMPQVPGNIPEAQRQMLMQVLSMTPDQIKSLPEADQTAILQLRAQLIPNAP